MPKELKKEQIDAINLENDIVVSANAGSGKTFVMLQRVVHFVADKGQSVLDFLLITFTDAAANQMLSKLQKELLKKYADEKTSKEQKKHIKEELAKISVADISTIHTFCYKLIKKYFYVVGVSANCTICDEDMSAALKEKAMQYTLNYYAGGKNEKFLSLMQTYDNKRNFKTIREIVLKIYNHISNQVDEEDFEEKIEKVYTDYETTSITNIINNYIVSAFAHFQERFEELSLEVRQANCKPLMQCVESVESKISLINKNNSFRENHSLIFNKMNGFLNKPQVDDEFKDLSERYAALKADLNKEIKYIKEKLYLNRDINTLKQDLLWCKNNVLSLIEMEKTFKAKYDELKRNRALLDFSDLEHLSYKILCDPKICDEVRKTYKQIFVDEYQDVNDIQEALIQKLNGGTNTVFLVGDPKQSIYGFRNTNPQIMLNKLENFSHSTDKETIPLTYNFRSDKNILGFSNFLFSQIMTKQSSGIDYQQDGMFECGLDYPQTNLPNVELCIIPYEKDSEEKVVPQEVYSVEDAKIKEEQDNIYALTEAEFIASKISELISDETLIYDADYKENNGMRKVEWSDIAILYRSRGAYLDAIIKRLKDLNIPIKAVSSENVLEKIEVQSLLNYLKLLANTKDDYALVGFLTSPMINISFDELATIREQEKGDFCELLKNNRNNNAKLNYAFSLIEEGREKLLNSTIYCVLTWLCEQTNYQSLLKSLPDGEEKVMNVSAYLNDFLSHSYNNDLLAYLSYIEENEKASVAQNAESDGDAVSVVTMHHSKGLEFPICFVVDMAHEFNKADLSGPALFSTELGIGVQKFDKENRYRCSTIARSAIIVSENEKSFSEEMRVLYVGLTRAKNHLYVIGKAKLEKLKHDTSFYNIRHKQDSMSIILSCLSNKDIESIKMGQQKLTIKTDEGTYFRVNVLEHVEIEQIETKPEKTKLFNCNLNQLLDDIEKNNQVIEEQKKPCNIAFKSSVSRIMEKEDARVSYPQNIQKLFVSEDGVSASEIGLAYHKAMQIIPLELTSEEEVKKFLQENMEEDEFKLVSCDKITKCLLWLQPYLKGATKVIREGQFLLNIPYNKIITDSDVEEKVLIQGVVDLVIVKDDEAILIDYKTNRENDDDKMREKYKIQLECYKIAVENAIKRAVSHKILYSFFKDCEILFDK